MPCSLVSQKEYQELSATAELSRTCAGEDQRVGAHYACSTIAAMALCVFQDRFEGTFISFQES